MNFIPVTFPDESTVACSFSLRTSGDQYAPYSRILALHVAGEYRTGSGGAPDARLIAGHAAAGIMIWYPDAFVLDLRKLDYRWGDEMDMLLGLPEGAPDMPFALVGSDLCLPAISTLIFGERTTRHALEKEEIFDEFDEAAAYLESKLVVKREELRRLFSEGKNA